MDTTGANHSVQGSWQGQYFYSHAPSEGHGFEAVFVDISGIIEGNILDDGVLGEAIVAGSFKYPHISFTKLYRGRHAVRYDGTMSEDGKELSGHWQITSANGGTWRACRSSDEDSPSLEDLVKRASNIDEDAQVEEALPQLAPMKRNKRP